MAGIVGAIWPEFGKELKPLGTMFVNLIKMMITPIISARSSWASARCAAPHRSAASAACLGYFLTMSTMAG